MPYRKAMLTLLWGLVLLGLGTVAPVAAQTAGVDDHDRLAKKSSPGRAWPMIGPTAAWMFANPIFLF